MFGLLFLFSAFSASTARRHGRQEEHQPEYEDFRQNQQQDLSQEQYEEDSTESLADRYLKDFDKLQTQGQKYPACVL